MTFDLGKSYKTRGGWRAEILSIETFEDFPDLIRYEVQHFHSYFCSPQINITTLWHNVNGKRFFNGGSLFDLTSEEWKDESKGIQILVGPPEK